MVKYRIAYGCIVAVSFLLLLMTGHPFALILCIGLLLLFGLFLMLLSRDVRQIEVDAACRQVCRVGQDLRLSIHIVTHRWLLVAGFLRIRIRYVNRMFVQEEQQEIRIPLRGGRKELHREYEYVTQLCGQEQIRIERIDCYDILGLCRWTVRQPKEQSVLIYPEQLDIRINTRYITQGILNGEQISSGQKGNDTTEIFELKKYQPGDDVRQIHWKLSEKMNELLIKEGSDPAHNSLVLLFDGGKRCGDQPVDSQQLLTAVELAASIGEALTAQGIQYDMMAAGRGELYRTSVRSQGDYAQMLEQWLGRTLVEASNSGMKHFFAQHYEQEYARLLYITVEELPGEIELSAGDMDITALMVKRDGKEVQAIREKNYQILELPYAYIQEHTCQIDM